MQDSSLAGDVAPVFQAFSGLGDGIEARWRALDYAESAFPELAAEALRYADLPAALRLDDVLRAAVASPRLPWQRDPASRFGDPALTLYDGSRFHIDVYVWFSSTTALHQHAFAGAFQVLEGASIHGHYTFATTREVNPHFRLGRIGLLRCEVLERGAVQPIAPGSAYIHRLFHLDQPSATIVVRTTGSPAHQPQFSYDPPCVAYDPFFEEATSTKQLQCLAALFRGSTATGHAASGRNEPSHPEQGAAIDATSAWLARADLHTAFRILTAARRFGARGDLGRHFGVGDDERARRFRRLLDAARSRHGAVIDELEEVFAEQERLEFLVAQRGNVTDPEHRFFLALLLNVDDRESIFTLIARRYPGEEPRAKVLGWLRALARTRIFGAAVPNALGIAGFDDFDLLVVEQVLDGASDAAIAGALLAEEGGPVEAQLQLATRLAKLRAAAILRPLLRSSA